MKTEKKEFTKNKNGIKENLKQKICPLTFCTNLHILFTVISVFILMNQINSSQSVIL